MIGHGAAGRSPGDDTVRNRLRQVGVEVVAAADAVVGRQGARGEVVRHPRVEPAEVRVQLGLAVTHDVVGCTDARRPVVLQLEVFDQLAVERLLFITEAGVDGQARARLPRVLHEEVLVALQRAAAGVEVRPRDAIDAPEVHVRQDRHAGTGRRDSPVLGGERRAGALASLKVRHVVVLEPVLDLVRVQDTGRFDDVLVVHAAVALVQPDASGQHVRGDRRVGNVPLVDRRALGNRVQRPRVVRLDQPAVRQDAVVAAGLVVAAVVERAEARGVLRGQRIAPLRPVLRRRRVAEERRVEAVAVVELERALGGIGDVPASAIDVAEALERKSLGRVQRPRVPLRIDGAEEEGMVFGDRTTALDAAVVQAGVDGLQRTVY